MGFAFAERTTQFWRDVPSPAGMKDLAIKRFEILVGRNGWVVEKMVRAPQPFQSGTGVENVCETRVISAISPSKIVVTRMFLSMLIIICSPTSWLSKKSAIPSTANTVSPGGIVVIAKADGAEHFLEAEVVAS